MEGLMQEAALTVSAIFRRAESIWPAKRLTTAGPAGIQRTTYGAWADRTRRLGNVLDALEIAPDARVATFAWNSARHLELYLAAPCSGRVLHTLNIRLFADQLVYIAKFYWWETGYLRSLDIMHDRAGFYICWGCLVWVPSVYTSASLTDHALLRAMKARCALPVGPFT